MRTSRLFVAILCCAFVWLAFAPEAAAYTYTTAGGSCPNGVTWPDSSIPVSYYVNKDTASGLSYSPVQSAIDSGFDRWGRVCCASFSASYQGKTSATVTPSSGTQNGSSKQVMDWEENNWPQQLPGNAAAVTLVRYTTRSCEYTHADLLYNGVKYNWNTSGNISSSSLDVEVVTTHEAGHLLGLRHSSNSNATMYAQLQSISQRSLHQDDKNGVCYLYPKGEKCNGRDDNCDGQVDEGNLVQNCDKQQGICQGTQVSCSNGSYPSCGGAEYGSDYEQQESSCDGKDNDCDGSVDEELTRDCSLQKGVCQGTSVTCSSGNYPSCGAAEYGSDYEQQESSCDGKDNDCDGSVDEMLRQTYWRDNDKDGFGTPGETTEACPPAPDGYVDNDGDCAPSDSDEPGADGNCTVDTGVADTMTADTGNPTSDVTDRDTATDDTGSSDTGTRDTGVLDTTTADTTDRPASPDTESTAGSDLSSDGSARPDDRRSEGGCSCSASPNSTAPWLPLHLFVLAVVGLRARTRRDR